MNKEIDKDELTQFIAIYFDIDTSILVERIVNRRSCPVCGEIYNLEFKPPKQLDTVIKTVQNLLSVKMIPEKLHNQDLIHIIKKQLR